MHTHTLSLHLLQAIRTAVHHRPHSQLSQPSRIKDGGATCHLVPPDSPWFLSPRRQPACLHNLLERVARHGPALVACRGADQPCVAATWRPAWQLISITVTHMHSPFLRVHHRHDLQVRQQSELCSNSGFIHTSLLLKQLVSFVWLSTYVLSLLWHNCRDVWSADPRLKQHLKCLCIHLCLTIGVILMADLCVVQPMLEQQICVLGCACPSPPAHTLSRPVLIGKWRDEPWQVTASNAAWHLISAVVLTEKQTLTRAWGIKIDPWGEMGTGGSG